MLYKDDKVLYTTLSKIIEILRNEPEITVDNIKGWTVKGLSAKLEQDEKEIKTTLDDVIQHPVILVKKFLPAIGKTVKGEKEIYYLK